MVDPDEDHRVERALRIEAPPSNVNLNPYNPGSNSSRLPSDVTHEVRTGPSSSWINGANSTKSPGLKPKSLGAE